MRRIMGALALIGVTLVSIAGYRVWDARALGDRSLREQVEAVVAQTPPGGGFVAADLNADVFDRFYVIGPRFVDAPDPQHPRLRLGSS
jgi:hypothetical protein